MGLHGCKQVQNSLDKAQPAPIECLCVRYEDELDASVDYTTKHELLASVSSLPASKSSLCVNTSEHGASGTVEVLQESSRRYMR